MNATIWRVRSRSRAAATALDQGWDTAPTMPAAAVGHRLVRSAASRPAMIASAASTIIGGSPATSARNSVSLIPSMRVNASATAGLVSISSRVRSELRVLTAPSLPGSVTHSQASSRVGDRAAGYPASRSRSAQGDSGCARRIAWASQAHSSTGSLGSVIPQSCSSLGRGDFACQRSWTAGATHQVRPDHHLTSESGRDTRGSRR